MNGFVAERPTGDPIGYELTGDETISGVDPRKQPQYVCLKSPGDTEARCPTHLFLFQVAG